MEGKKKKKQDNKKQKKIKKYSTESCQEDTRLNCSIDRAIRSMIGSIGKRWRKRWKRNPFSRYNRNLFLKRIEKKKDKYKGGKIEEWNKEKDKED